MTALSFSDINNNKVLPSVHVTSTGGNSALYGSKQGGKPSNKSRKSRKSRKTRNSRRAKSARNTKK